MKNLLAIGFDISIEDREQIQRIIYNCGGQKESIDIKDIKTTSIDYNNTDLVILFGDRVSRSILPVLQDKEIPNILLPPIKNLHPINKGGITEDRNKVFNELTSIINNITSGKIQTVEDKKILSSIKPPSSIGDLSIPVIQSLEKTIRDTGRTVWTCTSKDGRVVGILTDANQPPPSGTDYCITFAELLAMRAAMDVLSISEIRFVSKLQDNKSS